MTTGTDGPILAHAPDSDDPSDLLIAMVEYCDAAGIEPYPAQEEAFEAIAEGSSVVLATPTGSGKSLVALAAHFMCYCRGFRGSGVADHLKRSVYTAPTKALVNEKFFSLCGVFGSRNIGLMTGDTTVNAGAPIVCCTAEILESMALRDGRSTPFGWVVMDEFHYYADPQRGTAWLIPLLEMTDARFLLMSATLHDPQAVCDDLERRTDGPAVVVHSADRPVPLEVEYREDHLLLETIELTRRNGMTPAYIISFTKRDAAGLAEQLRSTPVPDELKEADKTRSKRVNDAIATHRFDTPFGRKLKTVLPRGIAVHHGGMLPKYRRIVERLAGEGLVTLISGTDTLGIGVNMPIRTVIFSQLYKFDGRDTRRLNPREFHQIAGRAGRKGHDDVGTVYVQAPEHEIRNARKKAKAAASSKKYHPEKEPRGFRGWDEKTLAKLMKAEIPPLTTRFEITGALVLQILHREGDGRAALYELIDSVGEKVDEHRARADEILAAFAEHGIAERLDAPDEKGCVYDLSGATELAESFDRPLIPFVREAIAALDPEDPDYDMDALTIAESILDDPGPILRAQARKARDARYHELRQSDQSIEDHIAMKEELEAIEHPKPMEDELAAMFKTWTAAHPFIADTEPSPKCVARDLFERSDPFTEYVKRYELLHDEQTLLYYLTDAWKVLSRAVPEDDSNEKLDQLIDDLAALVDQVDSSVADEWERYELGPEDGAPAPPEEDERVARFDGLLKRMVRNRAFEWVGALAFREYAQIAGATMSSESVREAFEPYWESFDEVLGTPDARGPDLFEFDMATGLVRQTILDPGDERQWVIEGQVDMAASRERGEVVAEVVRIGRVTDLR